MLIALTRAVPPSIDRCELTHLQREPIDQARAALEHQAYEEALAHAGCRVERLPELPDDPDSVFVEDTAIVFDAVAIVARPGASSRRGEVASVATALEQHRRLARIQAPGTLDGGDVIVTPRIVFVGVSGRTNPEGIRQLASHLAPLDIPVVPVPLTGCLHLKSAAVWVPGGKGESCILLNPQWVDSAHFRGFDVLEIDPAEPFAANVLSVNGFVIAAAAHPMTGRRLEARGHAILRVPAAELAKAEGGVTCCSIVLATDG